MELVLGKAKTKCATFRPCPQEGLHCVCVCVSGGGRWNILTWQTRVHKAGDSKCQESGKNKERECSCLEQSAVHCNRSEAGGWRVVKLSGSLRSQGRAFSGGQRK